ncbi:MAG: DUF4130 domain-containing protein [archaeon]
MAAVSVLMLKRVSALAQAVELAREYPVRVTGIDFPWGRGDLLSEFDIELGFEPSDAELPGHWVATVNQWCKINTRGFFDMCLRNRDLDPNLLVRAILKNYQDTKQLMVSGGDLELRIRKAFLEAGRENHRLKQFVRPQHDRVNMIANLKCRHRLFDLFGNWLKARNPCLHVYVQWGGLVWKDGITYPESKIELPLIGENREMKAIYRAFFEANYIPERRNKRAAMQHVPLKAVSLSDETKWQRHLAEVGIENKLTNYL